MLRPLAVANPQAVVSVRSRTPSGGVGDVSYPDYLDIRERSTAFEGMVAYQVAPCGVAMMPRAQSQLRYGFQVSGNFFRVLGTEPKLGRGFTPEEDQVPGRDAVVVLSHDYWRSDFGGDKAAVGRHIRLNGVDFTVIGVAPESFQGMDPFLRPAFFFPAMMGPKIYSRDLLHARGEHGWMVKGRPSRGRHAAGRGG